MSQKRVLSGMRPTGPLHLGHLHGVLSNWLKLQEEYQCFYFVADWHALTTEYENPKRIPEFSRELLLEWLAVGLDPARSTLFIQSAIKEHAELYLLFAMFTPVSWLERNPTYKDMIKELKQKDLATYGFLGYPVLQAADILIYKAHKVPVGVDQLPHLELTREIARRFNFLYETEVFPLPEPLLSDVPKVPGLDGRKMSKSYGNAIFLSDDEKTVRQKISTMVTDVNRPRKSDPGDPENRCVAFQLIKLYFPAEEQEEIIAGCKEARLGCVECKKKLADKIVEALRPLWERRRKLKEKPSLFEEIMASGNEKARQVARETLDTAKEALFGTRWF
ncbi:tryptophanyl-tRNA synthetase [Thermodesulfatator indicus DSM 15286]|uniref:Tryptophan--tRNA ligase n=1 Tax=Thermodesulfatator indicus (strain DSM 15286 / JCM 11887 / CIR29812) TaxID=667014 RepID=F8ADD8_THEID|nr:tryptophan--tRNA ligase [Thermodesulfatator indicus]AEH45953.1 tryptophanyl-tRNA synthetase [Thermodesulfatator indicus DSM 15286]